MTLLEALCEAAENKNKCIRPAIWSGDGDGVAWVVRKGRVTVPDAEDRNLTVLPSDVSLLTGEWETLTLAQLEREVVEKETGV